MSVKSTIDIYRSEALNLIQTWLQQASDEALSRVLEELNDAREQAGEDSLSLHNFNIISSSTTRPWRAT